MNINWKVRFKNPVWWAQVVVAILTPILAYMGLTAEDITTWGILGNLLWEALLNPYVLALVAVSVFNATTDPTTKGVGDSARAMSYIEPHSGEAEEGETDA